MLQLLGRLRVELDEADANVVDLLRQLAGGRNDDALDMVPLGCFVSAQEFLDTFMSAQ